MRNALRKRVNDDVIAKFGSARPDLLEGYKFCNTVCKEHCTEIVVTGAESFAPA